MLKAYAEVEKRVAEGTAELIELNKELKLEILNRKDAEKALRNRTIELKNKAASLEEANAALKVLLKQRDADKIELEEKVLLNINELIVPYLEKLKRRKLVPFHLKKLRATPAEWETFKAFMTGDAQKDFEIIIEALRKTQKKGG